MLKPYRMLLVVQGFCSVLHDDALGLTGTQDFVR